MNIKKFNSIIVQEHNINLNLKNFHSRADLFFYSHINIHETKEKEEEKKRDTSTLKLP